MNKEGTAQDVNDPPPSRNQNIQRRVIEKNRRNYMKSLYSKLYSLLPNHTSQELASVPDQIDQAVKYIKSLEKRVKEKSKEKKEKFLQESRAGPCHLRNEKAESSGFPNFEIHAMGHGMDVVLINGLDKDVGLFYGIIRMLHEQGFDVINASFSVSGNAIVQVVNKEARNTTEVAERLRELMHGSAQGEQDSGLDIWDFEIEPDLWGSEILDAIPIMQCQ